MFRQEWMSAEEWLTILVCRLHRNEVIEDEIRKVVESEIIDCKKLEAICHKQRIYPQLADAVCNTALRNAFPEERVQQIDRDLRISDLRYLKYEQEIKKIQMALDEINIKMVVFKGISYYGTLFPSRRQRSLGDIDMIVARKDMVATVRRLEEIGYEAIEKTVGWSDEQYAVEAERCIHTAQFIGPSGIEIELHTPTYFYTGYSLQTAYDRAVTQRAGIRVPELQDIFWIACVHSWHHYSIRKNPLRTWFNLMGYLLDVHAGYERMCQDYTREEILAMAAEYDIADIVRFIVYTAYHVLDPEHNPMELRGEEFDLIDWRYPEMVLTLEYRLLRSDECADVMDEQRIRVTKPVVIAAHTPAKVLPYRLQASCFDPEGKWPTNILDAGAVENPEQYFDFNITWTSEHLVLEFQQGGYMLWPSGTDTYDDFMSHLMLRVGYEYEKAGVYIVFQCSDGVVRGYLAEDNRPWDIKAYWEPAILCDSQDSVYRCQIPWDILGISKAESGMKFYLDLQARLTTDREKRFIDICWQAGNCGCEWDEYDDCSFLAPAVLE